MGQEKASVTFKLENAEEVLNILRELKQYVGGGGSPGTSTQGGAIGTSGAGSIGQAPTSAPAPVSPATANPGLNPQLLPQAAPGPVSGGQMFGYYNGSGWQGLGVDVMSGRFFDPSNGSMLLGPSFGSMMGGHGAKPAPAPTPTSFFDALGGMAAVNQIGGVAGQAASQLGQASASGQPFYSERLIPAGLTLGGTAAGAAIGTMLGGPGIGTAIGAIVGSVAGNYVAPMIEADITRTELREAYAQAGYRSGAFAQASVMNQTLSNVARDSLSGGRPIPLQALMPLQERVGYYDNGGGWSWFDDVPNDVSPGLVPKARQKEAGAAIGKLMYNPGSLNRFGSPDMNMGELSDGQAIHMYAGLIKSSVGSDPLSAYQLASSLGLKNLAANAMSVMTQDIKSEFELKQLGTEGSLAQYRYQRAGQFGSAAQQFGELPAAQSNLLAQAAELRKQAAARNLDPNSQRSFLAQASLLEQQAQDMAFAAYQTQQNERSAYSGLEMGRVERGFERSLYSGTSASSLPWEAKAGSQRAAAGRIRQSMEERRAAGFLSKADEYAMTAEAENLEQQAWLTAGPQREGAINAESIARTGLASARYTLANIGPTLRGSATEQAGSYDLQINNLERQKQTLQQILETSKYLTAEQKIQYQTQIANLGIQEEQLRVAGAIAKADASRMISVTTNAEGRVAPSRALIRGAGGAEASEAQLGMYSASASDVTAQKRYIQDLLDSGMDRNSKEVLAARSALSQMEIGLENNQRALATVPTSGKDRAAMARLQTEYAFETQGYGTFGDIRENLMSQVGLVGKQIREQAANRAKMKSKGLWTDAMEGDYQERVAGLSQQGLGLVNEYNEGFEQRLMSQVVNMPGQGRLAMTRFTHREAAAAFELAGMPSPRSWGGSESQTREMREMYPRMMHALGSGNPANFLDRAISGERMRGEITINLVVKDEKGTLRDSNVQVNKTQTGFDFNVNSSQQRRPGG